MTTADGQLREYWAAIADAYKQLAEALPTMDEEQQGRARQYMRELAEDLPKKFRALL